MTRRARLFVLSGPSGVGKGTILKSVREELPELGLTVSATTRQPREGDIDGVQYFFKTPEEFDRLIEEGAFLEWAPYNGERYGTLLSEVERNMASGHSVVLEIEVQGGFAVRERVPDAFLIFVEPPSMEELERRLRDRGTEDEASVERRLARAREEMALAPLYDARIVNDDLDRAVHEMIDLIDRCETNGGTD